jgi:hypothetical protein
VVQSRDIHVLERLSAEDVSYEKHAAGSEMSEVFASVPQQ